MYTHYQHSTVLPNKVVDIKAKQAEYYDSYMADCEAYWHAVMYVNYSSASTTIGSHVYVIGPIGLFLMQDVYSRKNLALIGKIGNTTT